MPHRCIRATIAGRDHLAEVIFVLHARDGSVEPFPAALWSLAVGHHQMPTVTSSLSAEDAERLRAFERQRHDALATSYHEFATAFTTRAVEPLLQAVRAQVHSRLLDVATGPGSLVGEAARRGLHCTGLDLSPGMIDLARKSNPGIDFRIGDVEHLPFEDASFDAVVCNFGIGHFPYPEAAVAECARALRLGGRIALSWWNDPSKQRIQGLFREAIAESGAATPPDVPAGHAVYRFADTGELTRLLEGAGLTDVRVEEHQGAHLIPDLETLWRGGLGSFALTAAAIRHQNSATQTAIRAALERRAEVYRTSNGFRLPIAFKIASGQKPTH
jgi:ubiquinone/menaquinone biosynthesis C-methylase UbiE